MVHLPVNSFSPPSPDWGQHGRNALGPACPVTPFKAGGAQQDPGDRRAGAEHLEALLSLSSGLSWPGANTAARTGCVLGLQNTQLAATSSLRGMLLAPFLAGSARLVLTWCCRLVGPSHSPTRSERSSRAAAWLRSACSSPLHLQMPPSAVPQGLYSALGQLRLIWWHWGEHKPGPQHGGAGRCALQRGGFTLLSVPACDSCPFPAAQAPGSVRAPGFSGPMPMAAVKQTVGLSPTAKSINLQTV